MRLGISSYTYTWAVGVPGCPPERPLKAVDLLDKAANAGVYMVQIADNLPLDRLSSDELDAFARRASDLNIVIEVGTRGISNDNLRTYLRLAERLKSPILRVVIHTPDYNPTEDEIVNTIKAIIPEFERAGICLAIENHDALPVKTLARIIERIDSEYAGICLDTGNSFGALEGPEAVLETLGHLTVNLHIKDYSVYRARYMMGLIIEGRPAGKGQLDIPWVLRELRARGRDPNAILELWTPPEETVSATIEKENSWADISIEYLRKFIPD